MGFKIYMELIKDKKMILRVRCEEIFKLGGYLIFLLNFYVMVLWSS